MLKFIVASCLSRRTVVIFALLLFAAAGFFAAKNINIEAYPNPAPVILEITAQAAGLSAEEMERYYTIPMEVALYSTPDVQVIRSTSFYGLSFVRVVFRYGTPYDFAYAQAVISLQQNCSLPGGQIPSVNQNSGTGEIYRYTVESSNPHFGLTNLRTVQDWVILRRLSTIPGVININSWGGTTKEFDVDVDPRKLEFYGVTVPQIITALGNANVNVGGREIEIGQQSINIRGIGLFDDGGNDDLTQGYKVNDIQNVVLSQYNGVPVLVKDVANVVVTNVPRLGIFGKDTNDDVVASIVVMTRTAKAADVLPQVRALVAKMNTDGSLPPGVKIVPFYDRDNLVKVTTHTVLHNLVFGCILIFLIQWIFLGDLRSALIVGINIPIAFFFALILLVLSGESANLLSVGAVDFGIIVDSAVILVECIFRNFQRSEEEKKGLLKRLAEGSWGPDPTRGPNPSAPNPEWSDRLRLILISTMQIDKAVFFSMLIIVAAFVPLFTMQGVEGAIFGPMARTYAYALTGALIATFTVTPVLASFLLPKRFKETETIIVRGLHRIYNPTLRFALAHRFMVVAIGILFLGATAFFGSRLGGEFLPALEENNFWIRASMPTTMGLEAGEPAVAKMRRILLKYPEVVTVTSQHGRPDNGTDASPFSNVELYVPLKPLDQWPRGMTKDKLTEEINDEFQRELPGVIFNFSQYIQDNIEEAISGVKSANSCKILGPNLETLTRLAGQIQDEMSQVKGITDLGIFPVLGQPNLNIKVDRAKAARYGLNSGDINTVIQAAMGGSTATQVLEGDREWNLVVRYAPQYRDTIDKIRKIKVGYTTASGTTAYIPLDELADISLDTGASWIYRDTQERFIPVKFSVRGRDLAGTVAEAQARIAKNVKLPPGYHLLWAGEYEDLQKAKERLAFIVPLSLVLIIMLLYGLFNSVKEVLLALFGIPFAMAGGVLALYFTGINFSISAAIGFISLFGVSVMIGILLINHYNRALRRGVKPEEAMFSGASTLMRPLMMMGLSAGIGLLPAAISRGIGSEVQRPLATVVVGGMFIGPILLLIVVPALQMMFLGGKKATAPPAESK